MILSKARREELAGLRCDERRAREPMATEAVTAAYLHAMRFRGEDVRRALIESVPPKRFDHEEARAQASREWLADYLSRRPIR